MYVQVIKLVMLNDLVQLGNYKIIAENKSSTIAFITEFHFFNITANDITKQNGTFCLGDYNLFTVYST